MTDRSPDEIIEELRQLWVKASGDTVRLDMAYAQELADSLPADRVDEAREFIVAMLRLEQWLRG
jgi:hypothetical protein